MAISTRLRQKRSESGEALILTIAIIGLALIVTAHPDVDYELLARRARLVVDLRGVTRSSNIGNVIRL